MTGDVVELGARRPPVIYTVVIVQDYLGGLSFSVEDVDMSDQRNRDAVADALGRMVDHMRDPAYTWERR